MKILPLVLLAVLSAACQPTGFHKREISRLEGWSESRLTQRYGAPEHVHTWTVADVARAPEPWRAPTRRVLSLFPPTVEDNLKVRIKALSWPRGRILLTAWLHEANGKWIAFYAEEWNMDVIE